MKFISITNARKNIAKMINKVKYTGEVFGIGRRDEIDALIIPYPKNYNPELNEITNFNANSGSFDFLADEPDIYSIDDLKEVYRK